MMLRSIRASHNPWILDLVLGITLGLAILGIGGRVAMRVIAHATDAPPGFSLGGTMTVVFMGAVSGAAGGVIYAVLARFLPDRAVIRSVVFGVILTLLALRGTSPSTPLTLSLFLPLAWLYGALLDYLHRRRFSAPSQRLSSHPI